MCFLNKKLHLLVSELYINEKVFSERANTNLAHYSMFINSARAVSTCHNADLNIPRHQIKVPR